MPLLLTSTAFRHQQAIPSRHTCDGDDVSPALAWTGVPDGAKTLALVCDDPDAPRRTFVHWVLFGLPAAEEALPEGVPTAGRLDSGARQGKNSAGKTGYMGPCPPSGTHRYFFTLYAVDEVPELPADASKEQLLAAIRGHVLAESQLMGTYARAGQSRAR
jgi:Raf kinase inhibitor-like YbhB/YbcL family protein